MSKNAAFYVGTEAKYGISFWNNKAKDFGCKHLATKYNSLDEASSGTCDTQRYNKMSGSCHLYVDIFVDEGDGVVRKLSDKEMS